MMGLVLDQPIPRLDQKRGGPGSISTESMTEPSSRPNLSRRLRSSRFLGGVAVAAVALLAVLPVSGAVAPGAAWSSTPTSWTNGLVLCLFSPASPTVAVSALAVNGSGLSLGLVGMEELRPNGSMAAVTDLSSAAWNVTNRSSEDAYDLAYQTTVPLVAQAGATTSVGSADLGVEYLLPAYDHSPAGALDTVTVHVTVSNWTWQGAGDSFVATLAAWPSFSTAEHLGATTQSGWLLTSSSNRSGAVLERMGVEMNASATPSTGPATNVTAAPLATVGGSFAEVQVGFGDAGGFHSLQFQAQVGIVLPSTVAGIPTSELLTAAGVGVLASVLVAVSARWVRRRPSDLIYMEEP